MSSEGRFRRWKRLVYPTSVAFVFVGSGCENARTNENALTNAGTDASALARDGDLIDSAALAGEDASPPCADAATSATAACSGELMQPARAVHADYLFPDETLEDWVSYVEQLAVVVVLAEEDIPPPSEVHQRGEGYIGRRVSLRIVDTIWANRAAASPSSDFSLVVLGWILSANERFEAATGESPRMMPGGRYIVPLLRYTTGWGVLTDRSVMAFPRDAIASEDVRRRGQSALARELSELPLPELSALLEATPRDPRAEEHWDLLPEERLKAALQHSR